MSRAKHVSILRILGALVIVALSAAVLTVVFYAGEATGMDHERHSAWSRNAFSTAWRSGALHAGNLADVEAFGLAEHEAGNALALYWPGGMAAYTSPCARSFPMNYDNPLWDRSESTWHSAAACERLDDIVRAARMTALDFTHVGGADIAAKLYGPSSYGLFWRAPRQDLGALIARAHLRLTQGDLEGAEADARAAVSAGIQFVELGPTSNALSTGFTTMEAGLDHLREIYVRRGRADQVAAIATAMNEAVTARTGFYRFMQNAWQAAALPESMRVMAQLSTDSSAVLGVRTYAAYVLGYAYVMHPWEALFGPSSERRAALDALALRPELAAAVARAREGFNVPLKDRLHYLNAD